MGREMTGKNKSQLKLKQQRNGVGKSNPFHLHSRLNVRSLIGVHVRNHTIPGENPGPIPAVDQFIEIAQQNL